jgi:hypothetical protein
VLRSTGSPGTLVAVLVTNHVLSGAVIGALGRRRPVAAFFLGIASHFALDAAPHWGRWTGPPSFMQVAVPDGLTGLVVMGAMTALAPRDARAAVLAGMAGAALPDIDKPAVVFFGRSPFPRVVDDIHRRIQQREGPRLFKYEVATAAVCTAAAVGLLRGHRRGLFFLDRCPGVSLPFRQPGLSRSVR